MESKVGSEMTGAELRAIREALGLTPEWLAFHLGVAQRRVERWEANKRLPIPSELVDRIEDLYADTERMVDNMVLKYERTGETLWTYRTDQEFWASGVDVKYPARWHRMICLRVADQVPGLVIDYAA